MTSTTTINPMSSEDIATYENHGDDELARIVDVAHDAVDEAGIVVKIGELMLER